MCVYFVYMGVRINKRLCVSETGGAVCGGTS